MLKEFFDNAMHELRAFKGSRENRNGQAELRDKWNKAPAVFAQDSDHFYQHEVGDSYLYDLACWHSSGTLYPWGQLVHSHAIGTVWDFGGGIGTYSLLAAASPIVSRVYYDDINLVNVEFAQWRFDRSGLSDKIVISKPTETVDSIIALDVIEHLTSPFEHLDTFTKITTRGARMIVNITSHTSGGEHPMHIVDSKLAQDWFEYMKHNWKTILKGSPSVWERL